MADTENKPEEAKAPAKETKQASSSTSSQSVNVEELAQAFAMAMQQNRPGASTPTLNEEGEVMDPSELTYNHTHTVKGGQFIVNGQVVKASGKPRADVAPEVEKAAETHRKNMATQRSRTFEPEEIQDEEL